MAVAAAVATNAPGGGQASERRVSASRSNTPTRIAESHSDRSSTSLWKPTQTCVFGMAVVEGAVGVGGVNEEEGGGGW